MSVRRIIQHPLVSALIGAAIAAGLWWLCTPAAPAPAQHRPTVDDRVVIIPCEAEDSCTVDYYDGAWHIGPNGSAR